MKEEIFEELENEMLDDQQILDFLEYSELQDEEEIMYDPGYN